jgi:hypothetical protein
MESIYLISPEDAELKRRIGNRTNLLAKHALNVLEGINVFVPKKYRDTSSNECLRCMCNSEADLDKPKPYFQPKADVRPEQTHIHLEPRKEESIKTLWSILVELHKLFCETHHIHNEVVKREEQLDINELNVMVLRCLHLS